MCMRRVLGGEPAPSGALDGRIRSCDGASTSRSGTGGSAPGLRAMEVLPRRADIAAGEENIRPRGRDRRALAAAGGASARSARPWASAKRAGEEQRARSSSTPGSPWKRARLVAVIEAASNARKMPRGGLADGRAAGNFDEDEWLHLFGPTAARACPDIGTRPAEGIGSLAKSWPGSAQWDLTSRDYRQLDELQGFLTEQARISCGHAEIESAIGEQQEVLLKGSTTPSCSDDAFGQSFATSSGEGTPSWCSPTRRTMEAASVIVAQAPEALQSLITLSGSEPFSRGGADLRPVKVNPTRSSADGDAALDEEKVRRFGENRVAR